jgi:hypothetical protein
MAFPYIFQFRGGQGPDFNVQINSGSSVGTTMISTPVSSIVWIELNNLEIPTGRTRTFVPGSDTGIPGSNAVYVPPAREYFNWRTGDSGRHPISKGATPSTGEYSFDIWTDPNGGQSDLALQIAQFDLTWTGLAAVYNTIALHPNKHSVFYDYGTPYALGWKLGGTISIAVT